MNRLLAFIVTAVSLSACGSVGTEPPPNAPSALDLGYVAGGLVIVPSRPGLQTTDEEAPARAAQARPD
jgi:hypothetical protein